MLAGLLEDITSEIPRFKELVSLLLLCSVALVFTKKDGSGFYNRPNAYCGFELLTPYSAIKRTRVVVTELMWQPFTMKFKSIKQRFEYHSTVVTKEIQLLQLNLAADNKKALVRLEQQIRSEVFKSLTETPASVHNIELRVQDLCSELKSIEEQAEIKYEKLLSKGYDQKLADAGRLRDDIMKFFQPPEFIQEYEHAYLLRDPESGKWLFESREFSSWQSWASGVQMLWIKGKPGCGKSILASNIIDTLGAPIHPAAEPHNVLYFFYNSNEGLTSMDQMYRALLAQTIDSRFDPNEAETTIEYALSSRQKGQIRGSPLIIRDLFFILLGRLSNVYVIIDAIDECEPGDRYEESEQALREELQILYDGIVNAGAKMVILSRPSVWGLSNLSPCSTIQSLNITPPLLLDDLKRYCYKGLHDLCGNGSLPTMDTASLGELCNTLLIGADGMFLWMRLMFSYLRSPQSGICDTQKPLTRFTAVYSVFLGLCQIIGVSWHVKPSSGSCFHRNQYFNALELHTVLTAAFYFASGNLTSLIPGNESQEIVDEAFAAFSQAILLACSSLVELSTPGSQHYYRFIHATTSEFFLTRLYSTDCSGLKMELGITCLRYLLTFVPARPLSGSVLTAANRDEVSHKYRFAAYASAFWTAHLRHAKVFRCCGHSSFESNLATLIQVIRQFLESELKVNSWVELMYLLGNPVTNANQHQNLRQSTPCTSGQGGYPQLKLDFYESLTRLSRDLKVLEEEWGRSLREESHQIWNDVTAFLPSLFFKKTRATTVRHIGLDDPLDQSQSTKPLAIVSASDPTQTALAKLSIWPSREFENVWSDLSRMHQSCSGWTARYQLWDTSSEFPQLAQEYSIPLDANDVRLQVQHFLRRSPKFTPNLEVLQGAEYPKDELQLAFPMLISRHDINTFVILRTLYKLVRVGGSPGDVQFDSFVIPLDFDAKLASIWSPRHSKSGYRLASDIVYEYGFEFESEDKYLLYRDTTALDDLPTKGDTFATTLAVFELSLFMNTNRAPVHFLNSLVRDPGCKHLTHWSFHPTLPILAVHERGSCAAALWSFTDGEFHELTKVPGRRVLRGLSFSSCGANLIIDGIMDEYPSVQSITHLPIYTKQNTLNKGKAKDPQGTMTVTKQDSFRGALILSGSGALQTQQMQQYTGNDGKTVFQALRIKKQAVISLEAIQRSGAESATQSFISLPEVESVDYLDASIKVPETGTECLQPVLNKNPKPRYSMLDEPDRHFPALVVKDQRAVSRGKKHRIEGRDGEIEETEVAKYRREDGKQMRIKAVPCRSSVTHEIQSDMNVTKT
ncbi:uncharacterized protein PG986_003794 [Apiospora aurea]|uniref:NACHT domain-containing protein n=1 Tax=Apiospora aurea TaxID=335848 RepID=A0ABR1QTB9_9PEZI